VVSAVGPEVKHLKPGDYVAVDPNRLVNTRGEKQKELVSIAEQSEASTVFGHSNVEIAGSNPAWGMDVCLRFYVLCCPVCRQKPCVGPIIHPRSPISCL